jgi:16S rRNA processing protein RimM
MNSIRRNAPSRKAEAKDAKNAKKQQAKANNPQLTVTNPDQWLEIGKIVAAQGMSGEVRVYPDSDFPERFEVKGKRWLLRVGETEPQPIELLSGRYVDGKNLYVVKFAGVDDRTKAENLRGSKLMVLASDRPKLAEGEYYTPDLIGLQVFLQASGKLVGTVVDVFSAGHDLLEVKLDPAFAGDKPQNTVLIPFVEAIAPVVDIQTRRVEITPPLGLLEIND